jgi:predicted nucleotidyltransferase
LKKETLICNLQRIANNISNLDLPAEINGIYAFGSILREKENPHDIDLVVLYSVKPEQAERWKTFKKNFSNSYGDEKSIRKIEKYLVPYQARGISLCDAVENEELINILQEHKIEPCWAGCFSWTDVLGYNPFQTV